MNQEDTETRIREALWRLRRDLIDNIADRTTRQDLDALACTMGNYILRKSTNGGE